MKTHIFFALIMTMNTLQTNAMEHTMALNAQNYLINDIASPLLSHKAHNQSLIHYNPQLALPNDAIDKIIAQISPQDRANLKETCKQLSVLTSVDRINKFVIHNFNIGDDKDKSTLFTAIIKTNNPQLIAAILDHAQKETTLQNVVPDNAVCINFDKNESQKKYIEEHYLTPLLKEAIEQDNTIMIELLNTKINNTTIIDKYKQDKRACKIVIIAVPCIFITIASAMIGGFMGIMCIPPGAPICGYNYTHH